MISSSEAHDASKKPRYYIVTVGTSLIDKYREEYKSANFDARRIEELGKGTTNSYTHDQCMENEWYMPYHQAYGEISGWLRKIDYDSFSRGCSAELSSLYRGLEGGEAAPGSGDDKISLVHTNTPTGVLCARLLKEALTQSEALGNRGCSFNSKLVEEEPCQNLGRADDSSFAEKGIPDFTALLANLILKHEQDYEIYLLPTGGYKSIIPYAVTVGMLLRRQVKEIRYIYEDSDIFLRLPRAPLGPDFVEWHLNAFYISGSLAGSEAFYVKLEARNPEIASLLRRSESCYEFNEFGDLLWSQYQRIVRQSPDVPQRYLPISRFWIGIPELAERMLGFAEEWENLWEGMLLPQMVSHSQAHCHNLLRLADQLLGPILEGDDAFLQPIELYLLTAAVWLHDIGHSEHYLNIDGKKHFLGLNGIRLKHDELTYQRIRRMTKELGFADAFEEDVESRFIATLCLGHRGPENISTLIDQGKLKPLESAELVLGEKKYKAGKPILLAGLLALLDSCDIGVSRTGSARFRRARIEATKEECAALTERLYQISSGEQEYCQMLRQNLESLKKGGIREEEVNSLVSSLSELAVSRNEYRCLLEENLAFLAKCESHFNAHAKVAQATIQTDGEVDGTWCATIFVHPTVEGGLQDEGVLKHVNNEGFLHLERDLQGFNRLFEKHKIGLRCRLKVGNPIPEEEVVMMSR